MNEKIIEGNSLIAEFMWLNYDEQIEKAFVRRKLRIKKVLYNSSWDWLLPVVGKILGTENNSSDWEKHYTQIHDSLWSINIESVWLSVVEFIKWYNKQK